MDTGLITIFTGEGKGKTSAALGMTLRAVCNEMKVAWVAWYKQADWKVSEYEMGKYLPAVDLFILGRGFVLPKHELVRKISPSVTVAPTHAGPVVDTHTKDEHILVAHQALLKAKELLVSQAYDLLVCDELCQAVGDGLVEFDEVKHVLDLRGKTHLVLTGRHCPQALIECADTVSDIQKVKHAYDAKIPAIKGLDF